MAVVESADVRVVLSCANLIGESPVWSAREQALYWIDVEGKLVQKLDPETREVERWAMPEVTSCIGLRTTRGFMAGTRMGFAFLDTETGAVTPIVHPEADIPGNRFNDGKVDRAGRFCLWPGSSRPSAPYFRCWPTSAATFASGSPSCLPPVCS